MSRVEGILDVHDLHIWNISTGIPVLTAHVHIGEDADQTQVRRSGACASGPGPPLDPRSPAG
jgi:Co/Zn/Cd efflux system component